MQAYSDRHIEPDSIAFLAELNAWIGDSVRTIVRSAKWPIEVYVSVV